MFNFLVRVGLASIGFVAILAVAGIAIGIICLVLVRLAEWYDRLWPPPPVPKDPSSEENILKLQEWGARHERERAALKKSVEEGRERLKRLKEESKRDGTDELWTALRKAQRQTERAKKNGDPREEQEIFSEELEKSRNESK
jgi:hypothetical protein